LIKQVLLAWIWFGCLEGGSIRQNLYMKNVLETIDKKLNAAEKKSINENYDEK
jgi:hypothetical protein